MMKPLTNRAWLLLLPASAIMAFVAVIPLVTVLNFSFHDVFSLDAVHWIGLDWYAEILGSDRFRTSLARSILFSALALAVQLPLGIWIAVLLTGTGRLATAVLMLVAIPLVVPWNMIPMIWLAFIDPQTGLAGPVLEQAGFDHRFTAWHTWALILVMDTWHWLGLVVILAFAGLSAIPPAWRQAAAIDGASRLAVFRHIELPAIASGLSVVLLLRFVDSFLIYTEAFGINAGGPNAATTFLSLDLGEDIKAYNYGPAAARAVIYFLIVTAVVWAFVKITDHRRRLVPA